MEKVKRLCNIYLKIITLKASKTMGLLEDIEDPSQDAIQAQEDSELARLKLKRELLQVKIKVNRLEREVARLREARAKVALLEEIVKQDFPTVYGNYREAMEQALGTIE